MRWECLNGMSHKIRQIKVISRHIRAHIHCVKEIQRERELYSYGRFYKIMMSFLFPSSHGYIVNYGQEFVHCLVEKKGTGDSGELRPGPCGSWIKYVEVGSLKSEARPFIILPKGNIYKMEGQNLAITILNPDGGRVCDSYPIPDGRSLIIREKGMELAKQGKIWVGESGQVYEVPHTPAEADK